VASGVFSCARVTYGAVHEALGDVGFAGVVREDGVVEAGSRVVGPEVEVVETMLRGALDGGSEAVERAGWD